jgi:SAM-dependent methyltransferase
MKGNNALSMVLKSYKEEGFVMAIKESINYILGKFFGKKLIRVNKDIYKANSIFSNRKLEYSKKGFFYVNPMPTVNELNEYYSNVYWGARNAKNYGVSLRDLTHWNILQEYIGEFINGRKLTILNFGAGHGGISNILWMQGHNVINLEPSGIPKSYSERWKHYKEIEQVPSESIDIVYGSHSLEHVQNIDKFEEEIKRILKKDNYIFWEVPNADSPDCGAIRGQIDAPHTYYFKKEYFDNCFDEILLNDAFDSVKQFKDNIVDKWSSFKDVQGQVIRVLGRYSNL